LRLRWYHIAGFVIVVLALALLSARLPARERGLLLAESGRVREALPLLRGYIERHPDDEEVLLRLSDLYVQEKRLGEATDLIESHVERHPKKARNPAFRTRLANLYRWQNRLDRLVPLLEAQLEEEPQNEKVREELIGLYLRYANDVLKAIRLREKSKPTLAHLEHLAALYEQAGDLSAAARTWRTIGEQEGRKAVALREIARIERFRADPQKEAEALEALAALQPSADLWKQLLELHLASGDRDGAVRAAEALEGSPDLDAPTLRRLREVYVRLRRGPAARRVADRLCAHPDATAEDWLSAARLHQWTGEPEQALAILKRGIEKRPGEAALLRQGLVLAQRFAPPDQRADWARHLASASRRESDVQAAATTLAATGHGDEARRLIAPYTDPKKNAPASLWLAGSLALEAKAPDEAARHAEALAEVAKTGPARIEAALLAADLFARLGVPAREAGVLEAVADLDPENVELQTRLARAYNDSNQLAKAARQIRRLEKLPGADARTVRREYARNQAEIALRLPPGTPALETRLRNAAALLEVVLAEEPSADLSIVLARLYLAMGRTAEAERLVAAVPEPPISIWIDLAASYVTRGEREKARRAVAQLGKHPKLAPREAAVLAYVYDALGDLPRAIGLYEQAVKALPDDRELVVYLADAYGRAGERQKQFDLMAARARRGGEREWLDAADRHRWAQDYAGEAAVLAEALQRHPGSPKLLARRLRALNDLGDNEQIRAMLKALREAGRSEDPDVVREVATAYRTLGDLQEASRLYLLILRDHPNDADTLLALGRMLTQMEEYTEATLVYRRYLRLRPDDGRAWFELGEVIFDGGGDGSREEARAAKLLPLDNTPLSLATHGRIQERFGRLGAAIELYSKALATPSPDPDIAADFIDVLIRANDIEKVEQVLAFIRRFHPNHVRILRRQAVAYILRGRHHEAVRILRKLYHERPHDVGVEADLAFALEASGNWSAAMRHYDSATRYLGRRAE